MSLDLDAIRRDLHLAASDITAPTLTKVIHDLCAEVERFRAEADEMRRWAEEAAHAENLNALDAQKERAAVVAWLREPGEYVDPACARLADCIERGQHRRGEKA